MAKKCIGVREDTGAQCNRSASSGSAFCYRHQSQVGDTTILHRGADVYHCPQDGAELLYVPKKGYHRCKSCKGVLLSAKAIDPKYVEKISQLNEIESHQEVCPSCTEGTNLSIHEVEWTWDDGGYGPFGNRLGIGSKTHYEMANVWLCNDCGSLWVPVERSGPRRLVGNLDLLFGWRWGLIGHSMWLDNQIKWREKRLEVEAARERKLAKRRLKSCNHMDNSGAQCAAPKSQKSTHDQDYCYKHQPK